MKKILILGIGHAQVDAIKHCKDLGFTVLTCSNTDNGPGKAYTDKFELIDVTDYKGVLDYSIENNIDVIYSVGSDVAMPTVSFVSEKLNLPCFISHDIANVCNSKHELRKILGNDNEYNVNYQVLEKGTENIKLGYPFIMKPVDSQGQRGVVLVRNEVEFKEKFKRSLGYSKIKKVIIEEFVDGKEVSVNAYVVNGKLVYSIISDRISWPQFDGGIIHKHQVPSKISNKVIDTKLQKLVIDTINNLGINNGPVYFQIKLKGNNPKLIEVTPRLDGCHMWRLLEYYTSVNLLGLSFKHLLTNQINHNDFHINRNENFKLEFICEKPSIKVRKEKYSISNYLYLEKYYAPGDLVKKVNGLYEKIGYYIKKV